VGDIAYPPLEFTGMIPPPLPIDAPVGADRRQDAAVSAQFLFVGFRSGHAG
jgi:hypothetical protein